MLLLRPYGADQPHICAGKSKVQLKSRLIDKYQATQIRIAICQLPRTLSLLLYTTISAFPGL